MANLIDISYFFGELNIAQTDQAPVAAKVTAFITKYEPEYLRKMLGYQLFKDAGAFGAPYDVIKTGGEFLNSTSHLDKWDGLVNDAKISPIANYVYFKYMLDFETVSTGSGEKKNKKGDSLYPKGTNDFVSTWPKACRAWNEMVHMNKRLVWFLKRNINYNYPNYVYTCNELLRVLNPIV